MILEPIAAGTACILVACNLLAMVLAVARWRKRRSAPCTDQRPPVSILRPMCGAEPFSAETIDATFALDWPEYEIIFCVRSATDAIIPLVQNAMRRHPTARARLLVGNDVISANPKLNNCVKGWNAAHHDWIAMADSNVLMPPDYLQRLMRNVTLSTSLVVSMPWGTRPGSFFAHVECALLNTFQARWQYAAASVGQAFAQGKNMMWRREVLEATGGLAALGSAPAEDAAATRLLRSLGRSVELVDWPFEQPLGIRSAREVWARHTRWGRLRRATFPLHFSPEILTGALPPIALAALGASTVGASALAAAAATACLLYAAELALMLASGTKLHWYTLPAMVVRDLMLPALYVDAWLFDGFTWHGQSMNVSDTRARADGVI